MEYHSQSEKRARHPVEESPSQFRQEGFSASLLRRARVAPESLRSQDVRQLQLRMGNRALGRLLDQAEGEQLVQRRENKTGLPDNLKTGIESLSGYSMDDVKVHYDSEKPAQLNAHAYTQGSEIHVAPGQERHLSHEAWHVVQQKQGRVSETMRARGVGINDDAGLEREADRMGARASIGDASAVFVADGSEQRGSRKEPQKHASVNQFAVVQRYGTFPEYVVDNPEAMGQLRAAYLQDVTAGGTWGAEIEARHLAQANHVRIVFWADNGGVFQRINEYGAGVRTINILNRREHFEAMRVAPQEGAPFSRENVQENSGGGDCLYRSFFQAYNRTGDEPDDRVLEFYRYQVANEMRQEPDLDLTGILTYLMDEFEESEYALGAGPALNAELWRLYLDYQALGRVGGGAIPPEGRTVTPGLSSGDRDYVPRNELSRADRLIDRIGRLLSTQESVHVAVALDGDALVMSANRDTPNIMAAIRKMVRHYGQNDPTAQEDPLHDKQENQKRVKSNTRLNNGNQKVKYRRAVDIEKMKALRFGKLERLTSGKTQEKIRKIKAALAAGLLVDDPGGATAKEKYERGDTGIYLIPHFDDGTAKTVHGEMNVTEAIQDRRAGQNLTDHVYIGGTLIDCRDCNTAHGARNERLRQSGERWRFYSGGTHGNSFPNWYLTNPMAGKLEQAHFQANRFPGGNVADQQQVPYSDRTRSRYGLTEYGYDRQYLQYYFFRHGYKIDTPYTHSPWGVLNRSELRWTTDWQNAPRTFLEDLFLRASKRSINPAHSSFAEDSDSDEEDYDDEIEAITGSQGSLVDSYRSRFLHQGPISGIPDFLRPRPPVMESVPIPFSLPFPMMLPGLSVSSSPSFSGALVPFTGSRSQGRVPGFQIPPDLLRRMYGNGPGTGLDDFLRTFLASQQSGRDVPFPGVQHGGSVPRSGSPLQLPAPDQGEEPENAGNLVRLRLGTPAYLAKIRSVLDDLFVQPQMRPQMGSGRELMPGGQADHPLQIGPQQGAHGIPLSALFDRFLILLDMAGNAHITFTGTLDDSLSQLMVAIHTNMEQGLVSEDHFRRVMMLYRALEAVFHLTGIGQWSLNALLDFVDSNE